MQTSVGRRDPALHVSCFPAAWTAELSGINSALAPGLVLIIAGRGWEYSKMVSASVVCAEQALPRELWGEVLSNLVGADLGRALCACRTFASVSSQCWQIACYKRWPQRAELAAEPGALWRRQYELLSLRDLSERNTIDVQAIRNIQPTITERHRMILAEWLCEVRGGWGPCA